ncbi:hypothetical protein KH5_03060 [Urechidicola sp. KH5]
MKKIIKLFTIALSITLFISCDRDQGNTDYLNNRDALISFTSSSGSLFVEDGGDNEIKILVSSTALADSDIAFDISVDPSSSAQEGIDFEITSSTMFNEGDIVTEFIVTGDFDNALIEGKRALLVLTAEDSAGVIVGLNNTFELNLFKSCPFDGLNTTDYNAAVVAFDDDAPAYSVELVPVPGTTNQWTVFTGWGTDFVAWATGNSGFSGAYVYSGTITINEDFSVDFDGNDAWATGGTGVFSPCDQVITYTLTQALFTSPFTVDVTLTPGI